MAGVKVFYERYASPGDVEFHELSTPATLAAFKTSVEESTKEDKGGFIEGVLKLPAAGGTNTEGEKLLINVATVQHVIAI